MTNEAGEDDQIYPPVPVTTGPIASAPSKKREHGDAKESRCADDAAIALHCGCWERQARAKADPAWRCHRRTLFPQIGRDKPCVPDSARDRLGRKAEQHKRRAQNETNLVR